MLVNDIEKQQCKRKLQNMTDEEFHTFSSEFFEKANRKDTKLSLEETVVCGIVFGLIYDESKRRVAEAEKEYTKVLLK